MNEGTLCNGRPGKEKSRDAASHSEGDSCTGVFDYRCGPLCQGVKDIGEVLEGGHNKQ